jgi:endonuclease-3
MTASKRPASGAGKPAAKPKTAAGKKPAASAKHPAAKPAAKAAAGKLTPGKPPAAAKAGAKPVGAAKPEPLPVQKLPVEKPPARATLVPKLAKALKSVYKPVPPNTSRSFLDQVLFACCLENAPAAAAEKALARLIENAFDLNEVRVTTVAELAESLQDLPDPARAALALRRALQGVFESTYSFSLEHARKHSLAHGMRTLEGLHGLSPFVVHHVASTALDGHFIPLDQGALSALYVTGLITRAEYDSGKVPGLDRIIPKKAGIEFSSLLHQFGIDCLTNLHGTTVRKIIQAVNPAALKDRFPKRGEPLPAPNPPPPAAGKEGQKAAEAARQAAEAHRPAGPQAAARPAGKTPLPPPGAGPKRTADGKTATGKTGPKPFVVKPNIGKPLTIKPPEPPPAAAAKPKPAAKPPAKPTVVGKSTVAGKPAGDGGKHSQQLAKRKPR